MNLNLLFTCTIHDFNFGFERPPGGVDPALLRCPICAHEDMRRLIDERTTLTRHRDLLLAAIDLKRLVMWHEEAAR